MAAGHLQVPDWFPWEDQGGGVAVADLGGTGQQDLILPMVDNPPGKNNGYYRVGKGLDINGAVTGGWHPGSKSPIGFPGRINLGRSPSPISTAMGISN
jgi:hypothetical protein